MDNKYDDIINLPHHRSQTRPHMSIHDRAAQFAPFAALTGYGDAVAETARLTDKRIELDEDSKLLISEKLAFIQENIKEKPVVSITYFVPDKRKEGGKCVKLTGCVKKLSSYEKSLTMADETVVLFDDILDIELAE